MNAAAKLLDLQNDTDTAICQANAIVHLVRFAADPDGDGRSEIVMSGDCMATALWTVNDLLARVEKNHQAERDARAAVPALKRASA